MTRRVEVTAESGQRRLSRLLDSRTSIALPVEMGRYRIVEKIGEGGMGTVFRARDAQLDRDVAIKFPSFGDQPEVSVIDRFRREARAMAALRHPNLCPVYDVGNIEDTHFLTMAFIDGLTLNEWLAARERLAPAKMAAFMMKLARAIEVVHQAGVVHRDLKPANVMVDAQGEPVVTDFGLALNESEGDSHLTQSGVLMGSPCYMAPEQVDGKREAIGPGTDIYALGVLFYRMLAGKLPFEGSLSTVMLQIIRDAPEPPGSICDEVDPGLQAICLKAMSKRVEDRFASAGEMADELERFVETGESSVKVPRDSATPSGAMAALGVLFVVLCVLGGLWASGILGGGGPDPESGHADVSRASSEPSVPAHIETARRFLPPQPRPTRRSEGTFFDSGQRLGAGDSQDVRLADLDGDGDLDAFVANYEDEPNRVWLNDGKGNFEDSGQELGEWSSWKVALGDLDGDGDFDAFVANSLEHVDRIWMNDGQGGFVEGGGTPDYERTRAVALVDFDGDGDLDALLARFRGSVLLLNDGRGVFEDSGLELGVGDSYGIAAGDLDDDGFPDVFVCNLRGPNTIWSNDGGTRLLMAGQQLGNLQSESVALADFDGDGDLDAAVANFNGSDQVWLNTGAGVFASSVVETGKLTMSVAAGDLDGDGDPDLAFATLRSNVVALNEGKGSFRRPEGGWFGTRRSAGIALGDLDADGDLDAFVANADGEPNRVWFNRVEGEGRPPVRFERLEQCGENSVAVALGDLDDDGDLDAVLTGGNEVANTVWFNDGRGDFEKAEQTFGDFSSYDVDLGDLDGDGDLDVALARRVGGNQVWLNDGKGVFAWTEQEIGTAGTDEVALANFDGDGDLDMWSGNYNPNPDRVWLNNGKGIFVDSGQMLGDGSERNWSVHAADIAGDGDVDVLTGTSNDNPNSLWINDGKGRFSRTMETFGKPTGSNGFVAGDLDGDGDLDLFEAVTGGKPERVWINVGQGGFVDSGQLIGAFDSERARLADLDEDGDLDAFVVSLEGEPNCVWLNDGEGYFGENPALMLGDARSHGVALGDVDGDGDIDALVANGGQRPN